ncbi:Qat anti-phage system QueC-like protein QatC [Wenyingzhuangia aestuarii]|uniref:Qat anti-phage system QueC-like protein QatC n=1 Tax=Wenyingzhuangia aestuarii TaxID=1647582 RepID=UPI00143C8A07|nr:Qat anti-phage system QueC-like protein QatC [Wenyingzhuangia aestuarii]NJB83590.1 7-cyano-7-deazaguanine synthase in queuosine biosynthesis [Wenyingzhuangia aestuarii]
MMTRIEVGRPSFEVIKKQKKQENQIVRLELKGIVQNKVECADVEIDFNTLLSFVNLSSDLAVDFFFFSASVYGIDRFIERRKNSVDGWSRDFEISIPVSNVKLWELIKLDIEKMLSFLTGDYWRVSFYYNKFSFPKLSLEKEYEGDFTHVNLFSGGLDSLIGALDHLKSKTNERILLVSHYDRKMGGPKKDQEDLLKMINPIYGKQYVHVPSINVSLERSSIRKTETTLRSRSLLFSGMSFLIAQSKKVSSIVVPENGSVSLNFPLSSSRRSACSTRTTHPRVLSVLNFIWSKLDFDISIFNPYEFCTKGEMVLKCKDQDSLFNLLDTSNSCGKRGHRAHWDFSGTHCGVCMPCVYRRASVIGFNDKTSYGNDINNLDFKKKKGQDIAALLSFLNESFSKKEIQNELIVSGVCDMNKLDKYTDLVMRTRLELKEYVRVYGNNQIIVKSGL